MGNEFGQVTVTTRSANVCIKRQQNLNTHGSVQNDQAFDEENLRKWIVTQVDQSKLKEILFHLYLLLSFNIGSRYETLRLKPISLSQSCCEKKAAGKTI